MSGKLPLLTRIAVGVFPGILFRLNDPHYVKLLYQSRRQRAKSHLSI